MATRQADRRSTSEGRSSPERAGRGGLIGYLRERHDPLTSLVLTIPVFVLYHLGILLMPLRNGVDLVSQLTFELLERSLLAYVGVTLGYAAAIAGTAYVLRRKGRLRPAELLPVLGESVVLAVLMAALVGWTTQKLLDWQIGPLQAGPVALGPLEKLVMAAGAGFHEEFVFRVGFFAGGSLTIARLTRLSEAKAAWVAALLSSLLFSAIHYVGPMGDELSLVSFTFRVLAGLFLVAVYRLRGFAVAVYTHTIYDLIVFFL